jgi:Electron transfer DM13
MMKLKYLTAGVIATLATLTIACTQNQAAPQPTEVMSSPSVISTPIATPTEQAASPAIKSGQFVTAEHTTEGAARIVTENGKRYLVLDSAFMTDAGPDLFVLLHQEQMPQTYAQNYISLGELQNVKGEQRYEIADDVDLANFQSVVIWCRQFNATFGYAPFEAG